MKYWQCQCGKHQGFGSTGPHPCDFCEHCHTTPAFSPESHRTERRPHTMSRMLVETDDGPQKLTRCIYCMQTKAEIEKLGQPMVDFR